ncbi:MAG: molybdenum cofactor biosynthesis protein MoaE, partial [Acidobacteriota bacterium]
MGTEIQRSTIQVTVLAFATASDLVGEGPQTVEIDEGSRLSDLRRLLTERHPEFEALWPRLAVAVGGAITTADPELRDGVEVALLPPVSGGLTAGGSAATAEPRAVLVRGAIDLGAVERRVVHEECGAVLLFVGAVRNSHEGRGVAALTYTAYESMATERLERIVEELEARDEGSSRRVRVAIVHRLGEVRVGEASVAIAVSSPHRDACYAASRTALERLK